MYKKIIISRFCEGDKTVILKEFMVLYPPASYLNFSKINALRASKG
jgi:hypothetical protein